MTEKGGMSASSVKRRRKGKGGGRPSELTDENRKKILNALRTTLCSYADAGLIAGISPRTIERWRSEGEKDDALNRNTPERVFWRETSVATAEIRVLLAGRAIMGSKWDPRVALSILERRDPKTFGVKQQLEIRDTTPPGQSPRAKFLARLDVMEERMNQATRIGLRHLDAPAPPEGTTT